VASQRLYLTQLMRWDDPHEAETLRQLVKDYLLHAPDGFKYTQRIRDEVLGLIYRSLYGQSWTILEESDAMWRIYSPDKMGIRISVVQADALASIQQTAFAKQQDVELYWGNVIYVSTEEAWEQVRSVHKDPVADSNMSLANLCFFKRKQFSHEQEYRFSAFIPPKEFMGLSQTDPTELEEARIVATLRNFVLPPVYYYPFNPSLIDEVTLDPRAPDWFLETVKNFFARYGNRDCVQKSTLYSPPKV
jgi:hypothetical protein